MRRKPLSQRIIANITFRERVPDLEDQFDPVQWQMPARVMRLAQAEARRQGSDLNTVLSDIVCNALTERAEAIRRINAALDQTEAD